MVGGGDRESSRLALRNQVHRTKRAGSAGGGWVSVWRSEQGLYSDWRRKPVVPRHPARAGNWPNPCSLLTAHGRLRAQTRLRHGVPEKTSCPNPHQVPCGPAVALSRPLRKHAPKASLLGGRSLDSLSLVGLHGGWLVLGAGGSRALGHLPSSHPSRVGNSLSTVLARSGLEPFLSVIFSVPVIKSPSHKFKFTTNSISKCFWCLHFLGFLPKFTTNIH